MRINKMINVNAAVYTGSFLFTVTQKLSENPSKFGF